MADEGPEEAAGSVSVPEQVLMTEVEGETVLLNLESGQYYSLDDVGTRMLQLLAEHGEVEPAVADMVAEYLVEEDEVRRDLRELVETLAAEGLLRVDER